MNKSKTGNGKKRRDNKMETKQIENNIISMFVKFKLMENPEGKIL